MSSIGIFRLLNNFVGNIELSGSLPQWLISLSIFHYLYPIDQIIKSFVNNLDTTTRTTYLLLQVNVQEMCQAYGDYRYRQADLFKSIFVLFCLCIIKSIATENYRNNKYVQIIGPWFCSHRYNQEAIFETEIVSCSCDLKINTILGTMVKIYTRHYSLQGGYESQIRIVVVVSIQEISYNYRTWRMKATRKTCRSWM